MHRTGNCLAQSLATTPLLARNSMSVVVLKSPHRRATVIDGTRLGAGAAVRLVNLDVFARGLFVVGYKSWL